MGRRGQRYARATVANGLLPEDPDGALRRVPYAVDGLRTLAAATVERARGRRLARAALRHPGAWIDYAGPPDHVAQVPFSRVANGRFAAGTFRDRIVVIGAVAPSLQDRHRTAWRGDMMAGPEIHANAIATLLRDQPLRPVGGLLAALLIVALALAVPLAALRARPLPALGGGALLAGTAPLGAHAAFAAGWIVPVAAPLLGLATSLAGTVLVHWLSATMERGQVRDLFARFVPDQVVTRVLERAHADGSVRLGGERIDATVMFSDLRGFTSFAETRDPAHVLDVLNRYLTDMSDAILDHGGTLVAYMGDGIMAVFGAPLPAADHADRALDAARAMLERLAHFNTWMRAEGHGDGFAMGIGLHSGAVMSGNVGSARRLEYAAIGDTTNTAARLEAMTKDTPYALLVSQATRDRLRQPPTDLEPVGELGVRGRRRGIRVSGLRPDSTQHSTPPSRAHAESA